MRLPFNGRNRVTSGFRTVDRPDHNGLDIVGDDDRTDYAVIDGIIGFAGSVPKSAGGATWEWGNYVRIDAIDGNKYYYCHLDSILVQQGQSIKEGQPIGIMGNTGYSFGAHTHFEVRNGSTKLDPSEILGIPNSKGVYTMSNNTQNKYIGIDVSKYQGNIDWKQVKNSGQYFAFIRVGFCNSDGSITDQSGFDPYFHQNMRNAIDAGMNVGVYVYSYADTEQGAIACANNVINYVKPYRVNMPIVFDYEDSKTYASFGKQKNVNICKSFLDTIQNLGYYAMLYTYTSFANSYLDMSQLSAYDFWVADYRGYCGYKGAYSIWQYSSDGSIPGISGRVDLNYMYKDLPAIIESAGLNGLGNDEQPDLTNVYLRVNLVDGKNPNEYFNSMDVNDVAGKLTTGDYKVVATYPNRPDGFNWAKILVSKQEKYAVYDNGIGVIQDGRAILITKEQPVEPDKPVEPDEPITPPNDDKEKEELMEILKDLTEKLQSALASIAQLEEKLQQIESENKALKYENDALKEENISLGDRLNQCKGFANNILEV